MPSYLDLDEETRSLMMDEFELDAGSDRLYSSRRFNATGVAQYPQLMQAAIRTGDAASLAASLTSQGCFATTELRRGKHVDVPRTAAETFSDGEFARFYARAVCLRALRHGVSEVEVYRARQVDQPRQSSVVLIGSRLPAVTLLDDLRTNIAVETALGLGGPNSGLNVRCTCEGCRNG